MSAGLWDALAECGDDELDSRPGVREVSAGDIYTHAMDVLGLPHESAKPFSRWIDSVWDSFNEDGDLTNRQVVEGACTAWCGGRTE